jgi:bacterioferritin-associated ferredoxin
MYVCVCNAVTESNIRDAVGSGIRNLQQLARATGCGSTCGCCKEMAVEVIQQALHEKLNKPMLSPVDNRALCTV